MKSSILSDVQSGRRNLADARRDVQSWACVRSTEVRRAAATIQPRLREAAVTAERQMRESPLAWTGAAVAGGIALGLFGRWLLLGRRRRSPSIVIVA